MSPLLADGPFGSPLGWPDAVAVAAVAAAAAWAFRSFIRFVQQERA